MAAIIITSIATIVIEPQQCLILGPVEVNRENNSSINAYICEFGDHVRHRFKVLRLILEIKSNFILENVISKEMLKYLNYFTRSTIFIILSLNNLDYKLFFLIIRIAFLLCCILLT